jgi:hypothetical protein
MCVLEDDIDDDERFLWLNQALYTPVSKGSAEKRWVYEGPACGKGLGFWWY